ncbi:MAG: glycosyltransferase family 2 protein [Candidatus Aureabacteria bacterium]|nr:glycosyltransferase family 2 protein [Candidatus Auribacterota bacterium]
MVVNERNLGYAGGNNAGIRAARGAYIALINNDTRADPAWLSEMIAAMGKDPSCGMAAGKILSYSDPTAIDNVGHVFYRDGTFRGRGRLEIDRGQYDRPEEVLSPSGCALLFRRSALDRVGLFDEEFFIYGDDAELSLRLRLNGWRTLYAPTAVVYHKYSASTGAYSPFKAFLVERNRIWLTIKYFPLGALLLSPVFAVLRMSLQAYGVAARKGAAGRFARQYSAGALVLIALKANLAAAQGLPRMWRKRREMKKLKRVGAAEFNSWFKRFGLSAKELALKE